MIKILSADLTSPLPKAGQDPAQAQLAQTQDWSPSVDILRIPAWADKNWLLHGFSTRTGGGAPRIQDGKRDSGDLNLGLSTHDSVERVLLNRQRFLAAVAPSARRDGSEFGLVTVKQMHSALVRRVGRADIAERASMWGDGLLTNEPGVLLGIQTADCLPILVVDPKRQAVAALHAGWRGTLKRIVESGVASMCREFGSRPEDLLAAIGPGIGSCCFNVGAEVRDLFKARFSYWEELFTTGEKLHLDLVEANRRQLLAARLRPEAIYALDECTSCHVDRFFSYRAERGRTGRMMAAIAIGTSSNGQRI